MIKKIAAALAFVSLPALAAQPPFTGKDYSGQYLCTGVDSHIGKFLGRVDMQLNPAQSTGKHGAYKFTLTLTDNSLYNGFAAGTDNALAMYFAHTDPALKDYGVGIATIETAANGKVSFSKFYYGPEYEGGGHGMETCIKQ